VREQLEADARAQDLDNVIFTGLQPRTGLPDIIAACDACLVHLRDRELFTTIVPSKFFEDAAMAKPIIFGFRGGTEALIAAAECGISIEPDDCEQLAAAVETLAADPDLCARYGANGRAYVLEHFDRTRRATDYLALLERFVAGNASAGVG